jgi:plastocyanin
MTRLLVLTALLAALVLPGLPAGADCEGSLLGCDWQHTEAERMTLRQVSATLPVATEDIGRYAALLPTGYRVPGSPRIGVVVRELEPQPPLSGAARLEAVVALRTLALGEEGWFPLVVLTDDAGTYEDGRAAGLPTVIGVGTVEGGGAAYSAGATVEDVPALALAAEVRAAAIDGVDAAWARLTEPAFTQLPVFDGPERWRTKQTAKPLLPVMDFVPTFPLVPAPPTVDGVTRTSPARRALVTVDVNPDLGRLDAASPDPLPDLVSGAWLDGLVDGPVEVPGIVWEAEVTLLTEQANAHSGGGGLGVPGIGAGAGFVVAPPVAQTVGYATPIAVVTQGGAMSFANLDNAAHDVVAVERGPDGQPLFRSDYANVAQVVEVEGVEDLPAGDYEFFCSIHPSMRGTLSIL